MSLTEVSEQQVSHSKSNNPSNSLLSIELSYPITHFQISMNFFFFSLCFCKKRTTKTILVLYRLEKEWVRERDLLLEYAYSRDFISPHAYFLPLSNSVRFNSIFLLIARRNIDANRRPSNKCVLRILRNFQKTLNLWYFSKHLHYFS